MPISGYQIYQDTPSISKMIANQGISNYPNQIVKVSPTPVIVKITDDSLGKITDQAYQIDKSIRTN